MNNISVRMLAALLLSGLMLLALGCENTHPAKRSQEQVKQDFINPPLSLKSRPLWFWNAPLSKAQTRKVLEDSKVAGYYGLGILPSYGMTPEFMTPEFLDQYRYAVEVADSLGMKLYLYDEYYFPSGMAGGMLVKEYPEAVSKRIDMKMFEVNGPQPFSFELPGGSFLGAVAMEAVSLKRIDLSDQVSNSRLAGDLPEGQWKVMIYSLNPDGSSERNHVDYLSPEAVQRFIELTYEKYYQAFPGHFGTTIDYAFYDEPCLRWVEGGRTWTGDFNKKFRERYGFSPVIYYPAMWFDIGKETEAARNLLFGFRAELFAAGFSKTINDWCRDHRIQLTGHVDQEEIVNPVATCGDLMKAFEYQDIPAVDQIFHYGRSSFIYKVISSSANNYDRPVVATECFGAISGMPVKNLYKEAMDQFAKGINLMEPHAVWYTDAVDIQPDLSPTSIRFAEALPAFNEYIGRLQGLLQGGQHVADIGMLYPIASLQGSYHFGEGDPGMGGIIPWEADYLDIGEMLSLNIRRDFTFVHPEILDEKCRIHPGKIQLLNDLNPEEFKVFIMPGSRTIKLSNLQKIKNFFDEGGVVVATSTLPVHSAEPGKDSEVNEIIGDLFANQSDDTVNLVRVSASSNWNTGGFIPSYILDGDAATSWKPAQGSLSGEWIEIGFGAEMPVGQMIISTSANTGFSCRVYYFDKTGRMVGLDKSVMVEGKKGEKNAQVIEMESVMAAGIRIELDSGALNKVSISEVEILDLQNHNMLSERRNYTLNTNSRGGKTYFIPAPNAAVLKTVLDESGLAWDVRFENDLDVEEGNLTYVHKRLDGRDIWFFANSSEDKIDMPVVLKGKFKIQIWNPHTGRISDGKTETLKEGETIFTRSRLELGPVESVFWLADLPRH